MRKTCWTARVSMMGCLVWLAACGGGGGNEGGGDPGPTQDILPDGGPDVPDTAPPPECLSNDDCQGKFEDLGPCETYFCNTAGGGVCAKRTLANGTTCDDGDSCTTGDQCQAGSCVPTATCECRGDDDCKDKFADLGPCETYFCDRDAGGGTCDRRPLDDGTSCDDGNACTQGDSCQGGACSPGATNVCDCSQTEDCAAFEDGDLCNGTLVCDLEHFPYKCVVDPGTVVACDASADTFCLQNLCQPATGECAMTPVREGETCEDDSVCTKVSTCQEGECAPFEVILCEDDNPCTDDSCDPVLGCVFSPNDIACDDGDACTEGDQCANGQCVPGKPVTCDNGTFCDGVETCDPEVGCVEGAPPDCDDDNACTADSCDAAQDQCVHVQLETAKEGPMGSSTCSDEADNDCDGLLDADDPECHFGLTAVEPAQGPAAGGQVVSLLGAGLAAATEVVFGGEPVAFEARSDGEIVVTTPPHEPGDVDVAVSTGWITFTLQAAYRYTGPSGQTDLTLTFVGPAEHEMSEGDTLTGIEVTLVVEGISGEDTADPALYVAEVGYGLRGTSPAEDPSWTWAPLDVEEVTGGTITYLGSLKVALGGYLDMAARVSSDGGYTFVFGDLDGSGNGYDPPSAAKLTVWGAPRAGAVIVNELMWMGSNDNPNLPSATYDEWFELRNMSRAPYNLAGYKLTGAAMLGGDLVLDDAVHTVNNLVIEPFGYFLVADYGRDVSMVDVDPDVVTNTKMLLPNPAPWTYRLESPDGTILDEVKYTGLVGYNGDPNLGTPDRSMERNAVPGDGRKDENWHTAVWHEGWDGDPFQDDNWGTPRGPNSDIALCLADEECDSAFPGLEIAACEKRACVVPPGRCSVVPREEGDPCDDGLFCTSGDACSAGDCTGTPTDCADEDLCTVDSCDEDGDQCVHDPLDCDDQNACSADSCDAATGECVHEFKDCADDDLCTVDSCDPDTGECHNDPMDCDDGDACTADSCDPAGGECVHLAVLCGDGDPCTADSCDPDTGCLNDPIPDCTGCGTDADCADATLCTEDVCDAGTCLHAPVDCSDGDPCTEDDCEPLTGQCVHVSVVCDDGDSCTTDSCDPDTGDCVFTPVVCDDGDLCTVDGCDPLTGACVFADKDCDDGNACTLDSCDPATGDCVNDPDPAAIEGPAGDATCSDGVDNDCDDLTDADDPQCLLALDSVFPAEYPSGSGAMVTLHGAGFDIVTDVLVGPEGAMSSFAFTLQDSNTITLNGPADPVSTADYDVAVTDGVVTASLSQVLRVIDKDLALWANTQWPTDRIVVDAGQSTGMIYGRVYAAGITDAAGDPGLIRAEVGYGPVGSDPFLSPDWVFVPAAHNPDCLGCGNNYEYMAELVVTSPGDYLVGFRFSVDGGYHWAYGDKDGWQNGWDPGQALTLTVNPL